MKNKFIEIERKFLVKKLPTKKELEKYKKLNIIQGYISTNPVIRIRKEDEKYFLTFKSKGNIKRKEVTERITMEEFNNLCKKLEGYIIEKTRYFIPLERNLTAELDIYKGNLESFVNVEVEFKTLEEANKFEPPNWFGKDITNDYKYSNSELSKIKNLHIM